MNFLADLTELGFVAIAGQDAEKFLQGQLTCDVKEISTTQSRLGAHCDPKGRVQFTFRLFKHHDVYYFHLPRSLISHALASLQKYAVFSKVTLADVSSEWKSLGVSGPSIQQDLENLSKTVPTENDAVVALQDLIIVKIPGTAPRFEIIGKPEDIDNAKVHLQKNTEGTKNSWQLQDIQAGISSITPETIGEFTPHDINLPALNGVSFKKGCYTGQEIVARMQYLGKLKQHLVRVQFHSKIWVTPGTKLLIESDREVGKIVMAAPENDHYQALAVLQDSALENASLHLDQEDYPSVQVTATFT